MQALVWSFFGPFHANRSETPTRSEIRGKDKESSPQEGAKPEVVRLHVETPATGGGLPVAGLGGEESWNEGALR